jgi:hypothetical protein
MQVKRKESVGIESGLSAKRVEAWVQQAESDSLLAASTSVSLPASPYSTQSSDTSQAVYLTYRHEVEPCQDYPQDTHSGETTSTDLFTERLPHEHNSTSNDQDQINPWYPLSLGMTIKTEVAKATLTSYEYVWAVAEIQTELPALPVNATANRRGIAVAIVLDNS